MARRKSNTTASVTSKSKFMAPTPWLEDVHFSHRNRNAETEFGIVSSKLTRHTGSKDKGAMGSKALEEMSHPTIVK